MCSTWAQVFTVRLAISDDHDSCLFLVAQVRQEALHVVGHDHTNHRVRSICHSCCNRTGLRSCRGSGACGCDLALLRAAHGRRILGFQGSVSVQIIEGLIQRRLVDICHSVEHTVTNSFARFLGLYIRRLCIFRVSQQGL